jgi:hypothetical protein
MTCIPKVPCSDLIQGAGCLDRGYCFMAGLPDKCENVIMKFTTTFCPIVSIPLCIIFVYSDPGIISVVDTGLLKNL